MMAAVRFLENYINTYIYDPSGEFNMKRLTLLFIAIFMIISGSIIIVHGEDINTDAQGISITSNDNAFAVTEVTVVRP